MMNKQTLKSNIKRYLSQRHWKKKINMISMNQKIKSNKLNDKEKNRIKEYWKPYKSSINLNWHNAYMTIYNGYENNGFEKFIPEDAFYMDIEPSLNNINLAKAYEDKNVYHKIFDKEHMPRVVLRNINGIYYDENYNKMESIKLKDIFNNDKMSSYIVKPSLDTQKGKNIRKVYFDKGCIVVEGEKFQDIEVLNKLYEKDFLVQENIQQHSSLSSIYEHSLNTIRIITLRYNDKIDCISSVIRFGNEKRIVDNRGIACGINDEGKINDYGTMLNMDICYKHPFNDKDFSKVQIPDYEKLKSFVKNMHKRLMYFDLVSWDIAIDKNGNFKMIEYNLKGQEINFHQINNGPLFGEHTTSVLDRVYR